MQIKRKLNDLEGHLQAFQLSFHGNTQILSAGHEGLRDRLDFTWQEGRFGLFEKTSRNIVDITLCSQLSPELQVWLNEFRNIKWPVQKASIRLRVGPQEQRGVWLDLANIDIKTLLDEQSILRSLQEKAFVEMGQRRKVPEWTGPAYKLRDPELNVWFQTWMHDEAVNLFCHVASFTQPSLKANKLISEQIQEWLKNHSGIRVIEFGSGIGNLTFPALAVAESLTACEVDRLSLDGLQKTWETLPQNIKRKSGELKIHAGDFQKKITQDFSEFDLILANPPRSGLMGFIDSLESLQESQRPPYFLYMSCFPESMAKDLSRLKQWGYEIAEMSLLDQFPQTQHYEVLTLLQRK
ncbi:methyltransferase [Bdellovibrio sp. HCB2-146]|uniref:methyltransferase n=1 Tax=Bdellovibrio sp. HCB2-146 TaxID=3394362 RepID=UPI0039BC4092